MQSPHGDEYYTYQRAVEMIIPHIPENINKIWCPFDTEASQYVITLRKYGYQVDYSHINNLSFFDVEIPLGEMIISNPPFSCKTQILQKLFSWDIPWAIILPMQGLFDSKIRFELFKNNDFEMLIPKGRIKYFHKDYGHMSSPNFQSIYLCHHVLKEKIIFSEFEF